MSALHLHSDHLVIDNATSLFYFTLKALNDEAKVKQHMIMQLTKKHKLFNSIIFIPVTESLEELPF